MSLANKEVQQDKHEDLAKLTAEPHRPLFAVFSTMAELHPKKAISAVVAFVLFMLCLSFGQTEHIIWGLKTKEILDVIATGFLLLSVHLFDRLYFLVETTTLIHKQFQEASREVVQKEVGVLSETINRSFSSLEEMKKADVDAVYHDRNSAVAAICAALTKEGANELLLMGVSLNDFVNDAEKFNDAFEQFLNNGGKARLLVIDPHSQSAILRDYAEHRSKSATGTRLIDAHLRLTIDSLEHFVTQNNRPIQTQLYRSTPTLFLCQTNLEAFVQPYIFWTKRNSGKSLPMLHYTANESDKRNSLIEAMECLGKIKSNNLANTTYEELTAHFSWIWHRDSITVSEHRGMSRDHELSCRRASIQNLYPADHASQLDRMRFHILNSNREIWLQGISLKSWLNNEKIVDELIEAARKIWTRRIEDFQRDNKDNKDAGTIRLELYKKHGAPVKILVINPNCQEAQYRAYREYCLKQQSKTTHHEKKELSFEDFQNSEALAHTYLISDTSKSIQFLKGQIPQGEHDLIEIRHYDHCPYCFIFSADDYLCVEQYHYGYGRSAKSILGGVMPLIEYVKQPIVFAGAMVDDPEIRIGEPNNMRETQKFEENRPYALIKNHLEFVWKHSKGTA